MALPATQKANSLPPDLRKHWEDAMAEKFPMTIQEAAAYIQGHYMNSNPYIEGDKIRCSFEVTKLVPEGVHPGLTPNGQGWVDYGQAPGYMGRKVGYWDYVYITDFRKTSIDKKLKEYKK